MPRGDKRQPKHLRNFFDDYVSRHRRRRASLLPARYSRAGPRESKSNGFEARVTRTRGMSSVTGEIRACTPDGFSTFRMAARRGELLSGIWVKYPRRRPHPVKTTQSSPAQSPSCLGGLFLQLRFYGRLMKSDCCSRIRPAR